jgi:hypothetical protein
MLAGGALLALRARQRPRIRWVAGGALALGALPWLGLAMALLACAYLSVQYLLALGRSSFIWVLGVAAGLEIGLLAGIGANLEEVALALFALQFACATVVLTLSFHTRVRPLAR